MRRLIINADDFGLTPGVNRAIVEAHTHGAVTSATLMANGPAFQEAAQLAQAMPHLSVGCHVVLADGSPLLTASQIPSLVEPRDGSHFRDGLGRFAFRSLAGRLDPSQVESEATAQIRKLQAAGISVSHFDTHKHTHIFPQVLQPLLRVATACGVRALRNPFEPVRFSQLTERTTSWKRWFAVKALHSLADKFRQAVKQAGLITPDGTLGIVATGALDEQLFRSLMEDVPDGTWEFVCHPGYDDAPLESVGTRLRQSRVKELEILTSAATRDLLAHHGIALVSYRDLA